MQGVEGKRKKIGVGTALGVPVLEETGRPPPERPFPVGYPPSGGFHPLSAASVKKRAARKNAPLRFWTIGEILFPRDRRYAAATSFAVALSKIASTSAPGFFVSSVARTAKTKPAAKPGTIS